MSKFKTYVFKTSVGIREISAPNITTAQEIIDIRYNGGHVISVRK